MDRRFRYYAILLLAGLCVGAGCRSSTKHYTLTGQVLTKDTPDGQIAVNGNDIPGFMPAMAMNYTVKDPQGMQQIQPGDRITADVVVQSQNNYWLEHLAITDQSERGKLSGTAPHELPAGEKAPDVPMVDQDGKTLRLADFKGKAVLLTFIYTRCPMPTMCPLISSEFADIHNTLAQTPALYRKTQLLSVSLDPSYDTAPVLRKYGLAYLKDDPAGFAQWDFVSTTPADLQKLASAFDLIYYQQDNQIAHSMSTVLLGPDGDVKQMWAGNEWKTSEVLSALEGAASAGNSGN